MRLLIDECLSPALAREAHAGGFEAYHVAHVGLASFKDRDIVAYAVARDLVLVTNNAGDFLRLYGALEVHPGLVIVVPNADRGTQIMLFQAALSRLRAIGALVNRAMEINRDGDHIRVREYDLPGAED